MPLFTDDQIAQLAPDTASLKAGKSLANVSKWPVLAQNGRVLWGAVQGSGKDQYRTQVDLTNVAFNCSCPSRKFPCKHGLGLLLLYAQNATLFVVANEPDWVSAWIDKRTEKAARPAPSTPAPTETNADRNAKSRQKRAADRLDSVRAGAMELDRWLQDMVRTGLLALPDKEPGYFQQTASRLVDAKAPGLASRVRQLSNLPFYTGNAWQAEALRQVGQLHMLTRAVASLDQLSPNLRADVEASVGLTVNQNQLMASTDVETLTDKFWILSRQTTQEDELTVQRNFLYGEQSGRFALILDFAYKNAPMQTLLLPGSSSHATLVFYPGQFPYRAVLQTNEILKAETGLFAPTGLTHWQDAQQALADVLSQSPWADTIPQLVSDLVPVINGDKRYLRDQNGHSLPIDPAWPDEAFYQYLALTGANPATVAVLRSQTQVLPLGVWVDDGYSCL